MLLVENTEPCVRTIGPLILIPGINDVDPVLWEQLQVEYGLPIEDLVDQGILAINKAPKPTIQIVKKTYSVPLLEEWLQDEKNVKGPIRKAVFEQLKLIKVDIDRAKKKKFVGEDDGESSGDA